MNSLKTKGYYIVSIFLLMSLLLHFGFYWGIAIFNKEADLEVSNSNTLPIEISYNQNKKDRQFVTDPDLGKLADKLKEQSRLLSKYNRRVKEESIASLSGPTKNSVPKQQPPSPQVLKPEVQSSSKLKLENNSSQGLDFKAENKQTQMTRQQSLSAPSSTIAEHIPNVKRGGFTVLNTDQFTYYSFFNRINEQIRLRWVGKIRRLSMTLHPSVISKLSIFGKETRVELVLTRTGEYVSTFIDQSSGAEYLDRAASEALVEAAPYLNPPLDLVDGDGFIRLNYSFFVEWEGRHLAKD